MIEENSSYMMNVFNSANFDSYASSVYYKIPLKQYNDMKKAINKSSNF